MSFCSITKTYHIAELDWFRGLLDALDQLHLLEDARFTHRGARGKHAAELNATIQHWTERHTSDEVVRELLEKRSVPCARVRRSDEVLHDPRLHESGAVINLRHPRFGDIGTVGTGMPIRFSKFKAQFDQPAAELGSANEDVYGELLDLSKTEIDELFKAGVI
ncbi:CaiB/BaiF family protein [Candidatus Paraburkholderia kirkii]|nr:CaiB/BaiF family protein [Candidatus Paraburkholderia kirkii]